MRTLQKGALPWRTVGKKMYNFSLLDPRNLPVATDANDKVFANPVYNGLGNSDRSFMNKKE